MVNSKRDSYLQVHLNPCIRVTGGVAAGKSHNSKSTTNGTCRALEGLAEARDGASKNDRDR